LYFLYKIISTINLTKELKSNYPTHNFVPSIGWQEDHDFEEINYFNFKGKNPMEQRKYRSCRPIIYGRFKLSSSKYQQELGTATMQYLKEYSKNLI
jgi:uncharacterized protein YllA (UPF0747 family)